MGRPSKIGQAGYLATLDGWRAIAILMVVGSHAGRSIRDAWGLDSAMSLQQYGGVGVHLFFAISGFLICFRLLSEYQDHGSLRLRDFYIRRVHRILPPYLVFLSVLALLGLSGLVTVGMKDWVRSVLFISNYGH